MKYKRTTSAEKAVVMVFLAALPIGGVIGYSTKQVPEPEVIEKYEVRTVNVGDYDFNDNKKPQGPAPECRGAWDDFKLLRDNLGGHEQAVATLEPIIEELYTVALGAEPGIGDLNRVRSDLGLHRRADWTRLSADNARLNNLERNLRQCADIKDTEE